MSYRELFKVRNNSIIVFSAQFFSLIINIISISLAARYLGVEDFGQFNYLLTIVGIGAKVIDFAFNPIIFRELSKDKNSGKYLGSVLIFRIISLFISVFLASIIAISLNFDLLRLFLIIILSVNILFSNKFTNFRELVIIPFKVDLKLQIPMVAVILDNLLLLVLVMLMPFFDGGILYFVTIYVIANIPGMLLVLYHLSIRYNFEINLNFSEIKYLFGESLPLVGFVIFSFIYTTLDILLLEHISGSSSVGIYSSAIRLVTPLKLIPNIFVVTLFAIIVKNINDKKYNQQLTNFVIKLFLLFSVVFFSFMFISSKEVTMIIFGIKYVQAEIPLKILSLSIFFDFFSFFILDLFTAYNKQKYNLHFILFVTIMIFVLNLVMIPSYDFIGSSIARVIASLSGFLFLMIILKSKLNYKIKFINFGLLFSILGYSIALYTFNNLHPFINIILSTLLFLVIVILAKAFSKYEMNILIHMTGTNKKLNFLSKYYNIGDE
jgi:O-antigen/teichoic acid export membrane protein